MRHFTHLEIGALLMFAICSNLLLMTANDFSKNQLEISEESVEKTPSAQVSCMQSL